MPGHHQHKVEHVNLPSSACVTRRAFPASFDSLSPAMPHFNRVTVQKVRRHNSLCLFVSILGCPCSVYVCRRMQQNYTAEFARSSCRISVSACVMERSASRCVQARLLRILLCGLAVKRRMIVGWLVRYAFLHKEKTAATFCEGSGQQRSARMPAINESRKNRRRVV
jgi:hypothetical protein